MVCRNHSPMGGLWHCFPTFVRKRAPVSQRLPTEPQRSPEMCQPQPWGTSKMMFSLQNGTQSRWQKHAHAYQYYIIRLHLPYIYIRHVYSIIVCMALEHVFSFLCFLGKSDTERVFLGLVSLTLKLQWKSCEVASTNLVGLPALGSNPHGGPRSPTAS